MSDKTTDGRVWLDVRENATGEVVRHPASWPLAEAVNGYIWSEGNFSCDCNRADFFVQGKTQDPRADAEEAPCGDDRYSIRLTDDAGAVVYQDDDWSSNP